MTPPTTFLRFLCQLTFHYIISIGGYRSGVGGVTYAKSEAQILHDIQNEKIFWNAIIIQNLGSQNLFFWQ